MVEQANELILDILPLSADTARLVRVYGTAPCVALPGPAARQHRTVQIFLCTGQSPPVRGILKAE